MIMRKTEDHTSGDNLLKAMNHKSFNSKNHKYPEKRTIMSIILMMTSSLVLIKDSMIHKFAET